MRRPLRKKNLALLIAALFTCLALASCAGYSGDMEGRVSRAPLSSLLEHALRVELGQIAKEGASSGSIGAGEAVFHAGSKGGERLETLSAEELLAYQSIYGDASAVYYKNKLEGDMLLPYMAMLYALENGFERAYFSSFSLTVEDIYKSYSYLTCDDPFFESNYNIGVEYLTPGEGDTISPVYFCLYTSALLPAATEKKVAAYEKAKAVVAAAPAGSEAQRAEYLYRKLVETTRYVAYENDGARRDYLYDALVLGSSNCDGFANALAMLYNLAGIESVLAIGSDENDGHAWVTAKLDNAYYHFDPTYDADGARSAARGGKLYYFRLSDPAAFALLRRYDQDIADAAPKCGDTSFDEAPVDIEVTDFSASENLGVVADAFEKDMEYDDGCLVVACPSFFGAAWEELDAAFGAMADEVNLMGTVDAYLLNDRGFLILYGTTG
ncbi:MAG: transglutaminase domain-containing protein [Clostridiaceae bacterium]|nr:hypothetical protein [Eubacteriales bacterium]